MGGGECKCLHPLEAETLKVARIASLVFETLDSVIGEVKANMIGNSESGEITDLCVRIFQLDENFINSIVAKVTLILLPGQRRQRGHPNFATQPNTIAQFFRLN